MTVLEERIARMSPEKQAEFKAGLERAKRIGSLSSSDLRAFMWKETQKRMGVTYDEFDAEVAAVVLREETFRLMTMDTAKAVLSESDVRQIMAKRYPGFNHYHMVGIIHDSLVRLYGKGVLFAAYGGFSNNPNHSSYPELTEIYDARLSELAQMEADARHISI